MKRFISTLSLALLLHTCAAFVLTGCGVSERTNGVQIHQQLDNTTEVAPAPHTDTAVAPVRSSEASVPFAPYPGAQVLDLTVTNASPYSVEVWMDTWDHKVIPAGQTAHVYALGGYHTAYAKYLAYTAKTTIRGRGVNPRLAVASATVTRTGYGIIRITQN